MEGQKKFAEGRFSRTLFRNERKILRENRSEPALLILIVQEHNRHDAQLALARVALRNLALQVLQEAVCKPVEGAFAAGVFLVACAAVGTDELDSVLLRIAVQSRPTGASHPQSFG